MPPWRLDELEGALHLFPGVSTPQLHDLFLDWGGSIRWCLTHAQDIDNEDALIEGIVTTNLSALNAAISQRASVAQV